MLPLTSGDGAPLSSISRGAVNVPFTTQTIKGVAYAMFAGRRGQLHRDLRSRQRRRRRSRPSRPRRRRRATRPISWTTDEPSSSSVAFGTKPEFAHEHAVRRRVRDRALDHAAQPRPGHDVLVPRDVHRPRRERGDVAGARRPHRRRSPCPRSPRPTRPRPTSPPERTSPCAVVAHAGDGELQLAPTVGAEFTGSTLPSGWTSTPWGIRRRGHGRGRAGDGERHAPGHQRHLRRRPLPRVRRHVRERAVPARGPRHRSQRRALGDLQHRIGRHDAPGAHQQRIRQHRHRARRQPARHARTASGSTGRRRRSSTPSTACRSRAMRSRSATPMRPVASDANAERDEPRRRLAADVALRERRASSRHA